MELKVPLEFDGLTNRVTGESTGNDIFSDRHVATPWASWSLAALLRSTAADRAYLYNPVEKKINIGFHNILFSLIITWHTLCSSGIRSKSSPNFDGIVGYCEIVYFCNACTTFSWESRTCSGSLRPEASEMIRRASTKMIQKWDLVQWHTWGEKDYDFHADIFVVINLEATKLVGKIKHLLHPLFDPICASRLQG